MPIPRDDAMRVGKSNIFKYDEQKDDDSAQGLLQFKNLCQIYVFASQNLLILLQSFCVGESN